MSAPATIKRKTSTNGLTNKKKKVESVSYMASNGTNCNTNMPSQSNANCNTMSGQSNDGLLTVQMGGYMAYSPIQQYPEITNFDAPGGDSQAYEIGNVNGTTVQTKKSVLFVSAEAITAFIKDGTFTQLCNTNIQIVVFDRNQMDSVLNCF